MSTIPPSQDPLGKAVIDFYETENNASIIVESNIAEDDVIPVSYLFRKESELPKLEKTALKHCQGKVLDVGAAAGCHSLILQKNSINVTAIEISEICCKVMEQRGIQQVLNENFFSHRGKYDTLLCLMNGIGISGTIVGLDKFLNKAYELLNPGGMLIFDSSDIDYMYQEEDGSKWIDLNANYYGEITYQMRYKDIVGESFPWLFIDSDLIQVIAHKHQFEPSILATGDHYDYLGILKKV